MRMPVTVLALMLSGTAAVAQPWADLRTEQASGTIISLRLTEAHPYREGEVLRAEVHFSGPPFDLSSKSPQQDHWQFAGLLLDPSAGCGSPALPCIQPPELGFDKNDPMLRLGDASTPLPVILNTYLPALHTGRYRVALLARKLVLTSHGAMSNTYGYADPPQYAVSNTVEIEVVAATESWTRQVIAASVATLNGPPANGPESYEKRRLAAQQIRFLDVPPAWNACLKYFPAEEGILLRGLAATHAPKQVCALMQTAVPAPAQAVSSYYLNTMSEICSRANFPAQQAAPKEHPAEQQQYWRKRQDYGQGLLDTVVTNLAAAISRKQGDAKAVAFQTLMERVQSSVANRPKQPMPEWLPAVSEEFVRSYPEFDVLRRRQLLGLYANTLRTPATIPLLESAMDAWKPGDYYEAPHEALQYLYAIDPARARARIVSELARERTWLDAQQLDMLPPAAAHFTDDALIQSVAAAQRPGGWNVGLSMTALAKYASPKALARIKAIYESQTDKCQPELVSYFVRVDPAYADRIFQSHPWDIRSRPPAPRDTSSAQLRSP